MDLLARVVRWIAEAMRATPSRGVDPADMGTAFGLDATTSLEPAGELAEAPPPPRRVSPFEPRPPRRGAF
jgi:hypothetical protein